MVRFLSILAALMGTMFALFWPAPTQADPADVDAAARGVVRVVIIAEDEYGESYPLSHGTGFAVSPTQIVTNAHVVRQAVEDGTLRITIVPPEGQEPSDARTLAISPRNDLALVQITGALRLPPLTIAGGTPADSGEVSAVGYPRNVDMAQGLDIADIFKPQPPVKSRGFISGRRPSRLFDTILHTAPIAAGNSGGPLLDGCGRVLGINSFGANSDGIDAEFSFAVSMRELVPFLRANDIAPRSNAMPCRSLAELDDAERDRLAREQEAARADMSARAEEAQAARERAQLEAEQSVAEDRENAMALAALAGLVGLGLFALAMYLRRRWREFGDLADEAEACAVDGAAFGEADANPEQDRARSERFKILSIVAAFAGAAMIVLAIALWFTRPGLDEIDRRVAGSVNGVQAGGSDEPVAASAQNGAYVCTLDPARSRITGDPIEELDFAWKPDGCVNDRTQYGLVGGEWSRLFVPNEEDAVSVNRFAPPTSSDGASEDGASFRTDRYLLGRDAITKARAARGAYTPPACGTPDAASRLGDMQGAVTALLPDRPNERLVYSCQARR